MKKILIFCSMIFNLNAIAQPKIVDGVVAVVGNNIVLKSEINTQFQQLKDQGLTENEADQCRIFEDLLFEKLLIHQAEQDSIVVGDDEVQMSLERRIDYFVQQIGSRQKLEQYYDKSIVEIKEEMEQLVRDQLTAQRMMREITQDVEITPSEVREYYKSIGKDSLPLVNTEVEYAQIIKYPDVSEEAKNAAIERLKELKKRVEEGSSFSTMAILYSEDPGSAKAGGEYIGIKRGQFVKEFEAVAFNLKAGEISEPFRTEYGYHIVQLQKRRGEELDLRHILIKPKISAENLEEAQHFLDSLKDQIELEITSFEDAAEQFSDDENSKLNGGVVVNPQTTDSRWETSQLDKGIFYVIDGLDKMEISEPSFFRQPDGKEGYRLVRLLDKTEAHVADLKTDYQRLQNVALQKKKDEEVQKWVEDKLTKTYVRVNNDYFNCNFQRNWIKQSQYVE